MRDTGDSTAREPTKAARWPIRPACAAVIALIALAGYGSSTPAYAVAGQNTSTPALCSDLTTLVNSVNAIAKLPKNASQSKFMSAVQKVFTHANALISSAKSKFPSQTNSLKSSISSVKTTYGAYASSASKADLNAFEAALTKALNEINAFTNAVSSTCGFK